MHKIFSFLRKSPLNESPLDEIQQKMTESISEGKPIYTKITEKQKEIIKESFEKISDLTERDQSTLREISELIITDSSGNDDKTTSKTKELSFVYLLDKNKTRLEAANKQMPNYLVTTAKALYYEETAKSLYYEKSTNLTSEKYGITKIPTIPEIPETFLEKIKNLPAPRILGWRKSGEKEIIAYEFLGKIYKGPENLREGIRSWIIDALSQFPDQGANTPVENLATASPSYSNEPEEENDSIQNPFINPENYTDLTSSVGLKNKAIEAEKPIPPQIPEQIDPIALEFVRQINDNPKIQLHAYRDAAAQTVSNSFPPGFLICSNFSGKILDVKFDFDMVIDSLRDAANPILSPLELLEEVDKIYNKAKEIVEKLVESKKQEISSLYPRLKSNTPENQAELFLGYMQSDLIMSQTTNELKKIASEDLDLQESIKKINKSIQEIENVDELELGLLLDSSNLFDFFTEYSLLGALSDPKFELWPLHLGERKESVVIPEKVKDEFRPVNMSTKDPKTEHVLLPGILYSPKDSEKELGPHFAYPYTTYFLKSKEIKSSKEIDLSNQPNPSEEKKEQESIEKSFESTLQENLEKTLKSEEEQDLVRSRSPVPDAIALSLVEDLNANSERHFYKYRDAAHQISLSNTFPPGFKIIKDYTNPMNDIAMDLHNIIASLESTETPELSPLEFLKVIDKIYTIAREKTKELIDLKKQELSSLYKDLNPNTAKNREKLFLGYMQNDQIIAKTLQKLKEIAQEDPYLQKLSKKISKLLENVPDLPGLTVLSNFNELFTTFASFNLYGELSSPKIELWPPHLGEQKELTPTLNLSPPKFEILNKNDSQLRVEHIISPAILYLDEHGESEVFPSSFGSKTYFFTPEEVERSKDFDVDRWINL